jgi:hypothetical protein
MLQGVETQVSELCDLRVSVDRKHPAMIMELVNVERETWEELGGWLQ